MLLPLLKHLSHSNDITGIDRASKAIVMNAKRCQDCRYVWPTCEASVYARYDLSRCRTDLRGFSLRALPETLVSDNSSGLNYLTLGRTKLLSDHRYLLGSWIWLCVLHTTLGVSLRRGVV
jgi:hypothetical protein